MIQPAYKEVGLASWYGHRFNKKRTANGEVFDKSEYTAAHKTLPLPSVVKVTNLDNGRSILVRVNDRGPFVRGRILDVSENAAKKLGFWGNGTARVLVELDRDASLELLKDPRLRIKEAEKKRLVEAYSDHIMPSSEISRESLNTGQQQAASQAMAQPQLQVSEPVAQMQIQPVAEQVVGVKISPLRKPQYRMISPVPQQSLQAPQQITQAAPAVSRSVSTGGAVVLSRPLSQNINTQQVMNRAALQKPQMMQIVPRPGDPIPLVQKYVARPAPVIITPKNASQNSVVNATAQNKIITPAHKQIATVQVISTTSKAEALRTKNKLQNFSSKISQARVKGRVYFRVTVSNLNSSDDADTLLNKIKSIGYKDAFTVQNKN